MNTGNDDDSSSASSSIRSKNRPTQRKTIHPSRYAHILQLKTKDEEANIITVCSIQDYRNSGNFDSDDSFSRNDDYLVSFPDDDSDLYSLTDENSSSIRNSIYSVKSGQELYSLIDAKLAETISHLDASLEEINSQFSDKTSAIYTEVVKGKSEDISIKNSVFENNNAKQNSLQNKVTSESLRPIPECLSLPKNLVGASISTEYLNWKFKETSDVVFDDCKIGEVSEKLFHVEEAQQGEGGCPVVILKMNRAACIQRALKWSGYKKLPEGVELTLGELRAMALRQQQQIDCQHQLLAAREQRLRFLKQQEARHHQVAAENERLRRLRERVEAQELKLRRLRALRGQLDQTNINSVALTSDLESIRALFNEKEKELSVAVAKVEELTRQLEEVRRGRTAPPRPQPPPAMELDKLRRELMYRNKLNEQQNARLSQQREALTARQAEMASIDQRISELQGRLQRKRVANRQLAAQVTGKQHIRSGNPAPVQLSNYPNSGTGGNVLGKGQIPRGNIAAVEPYNHIPHAQSVSHNFQALKHNAAQNNLPMKLTNQSDGLNHLQQDGHFPQQKMFTNGAYPPRLQATVLQAETQFQPYPAKQGDINTYQSQQGLTNQHVKSDQKILLEQINKYFDLKKTVNHNQNVNSAGHQQQSNKPRPNEQEFLPEFAASKSDPKYQTLPYNTKFTANGTSKPSKGQFYDEHKPSEPAGIVKVSSSSNVNSVLTAVSASNPNHMTAHSTPLTISKGLATPLSQEDGGFPLQKSESLGKCQEEKENQPKVVGEQYKVAGAQFPGGRAELVRAFSQQNTASSTGQVKPVSSVAPTSVQLAGGKPSPIYQTSSTKIQPVQPQTVSQSLGPPLSAQDSSLPKPALPPKPTPKSQSSDSSPPHSQSENALPPVPLTDPPGEPELSGLGGQTNQPGQQPGSVSSADSQMIIKARPLTIRKQPLCEQPKLKSQSNNNIKSSTVNIATTRRIEMPSTFLFPETDQSESNKKSDHTKLDKSNGNKSQFSNTNSSPSSCDVTDRALPSESSETSAEDSIEKSPISGITEQMHTVDLSNANGDVVSRRVKKGNLKQSGKVNLSRRVSFDPLALLLDASLEGELELVKKTATQLLQVANASAANDEGITALHNAICAGHFEIVKFLVEFGCDVNAQDSDGWTPLHCAASCNNVAMVRFLVENGACIFATTLSDHETAAQKCEEDEEGFDGCSEYLYSVQEKLGIMNGGAVFAVFPYNAQEADELSFGAGARLGVLRKGDDAEREWWWAHASAGQEGYVPRNLLGLYPRVTPKAEQ